MPQTMYLTFSAVLIFTQLKEAFEVILLIFSVISNHLGL